MSRRNRTVVNDAFSNPVFRLGHGTQSPLEATRYPIVRLTQNYALLNSLYRDNWIVQNIITTVPDDMLREWIKLTGVTPEAQQQFERMARRTQLRRRMTEGMYWGRLYGGAVGVMLIRGQEDLGEPLDLDRVLPGSFAGLYLVDRWSGVCPETELVTDLSDPDFGLPRYYSVRDASGAVVQRVHHSRVLRFTGRELPYSEKIVESYWGESELEAIYTEIVKRDNVSHNMAALMKNNVAAKNGKRLTIAPTRWCKGAGVGGTDRMAVYVNEERFLKMEELVPLTRAMTAPNAANLCYDTGYAANLSEVEVFYPQTLRYYDGI